MNTIWRNLPEPDGRGVLLFITAAGADAIGVEPEAVPYAFNEGTNSAGEPAAGAPTGADEAPVEATPKRRGRPRKAAPTGADVAPAPKTRGGTKQAQVIAMLRRKEGATIAQIVAATDWQATHGPRLLRRGAEEEARADRHLGEGRGRRAGLPHRRLTTGRPRRRARPERPSWRCSRSRRRTSRLHHVGDEMAHHLVEASVVSHRLCSVRNIGRDGLLDRSLADPHHDRRPALARVAAWLDADACGRGPRTGGLPRHPAGCIAASISGSSRGDLARSSRACNRSQGGSRQPRVPLRSRHGQTAPRASRSTLPDVFRDAAFDLSARPDGGRRRPIGPDAHGSQATEVARAVRSNGRQRVAPSHGRHSQTNGSLIGQMPSDAGRLDRPNDGNTAICVAIAST